MKEIKNTKKTNFLKKILIKICRMFGFEIIDQSSLSFPISNKNYEDSLSVPGEKSITLGLGETLITRKVRSLDIVIKTCTSVQLVSQNKKRIFEEPKSEYTKRTINSLVNSAKDLKKKFENIDVKFTIIDNKSSKPVIDKILSKISSEGFKNSYVEVKKVEDKNNMSSTMASIRESFNLVKDCEDLIYFVEDDYIHEKISLSEILYTYERLSSILGSDLIVCPTDYPYLYTQSENTKIFLGEKRHWRQIDQTLCTLLTSNKIIQKYWNELTSMCKIEHYPFEKPLHNIYKKELCISPVPSLAAHFTNINSIYGLSPNIDWKRLWDENEN